MSHWELGASPDCEVLQKVLKMGWGCQKNSPAERKTNPPQDSTSNESDPERGCVADETRYLTMSTKCSRIQRRRRWCVLDSGSRMWGAFTSLNLGVSGMTGSLCGLTPYACCVQMRKWGNSLPENKRGLPGRGASLGQRQRWPHRCKGSA